MNRTGTDQADRSVLPAYTGNTLSGELRIGKKKEFNDGPFFIVPITLHLGSGFWRYH